MREHPGIFVSVVTGQHIRERNLDDPAFDRDTAQRLELAVRPHGGQAPDQVPLGTDRFHSP